VADEAIREAVGRAVAGWWQRQGNLA
jgi:hypothetical protein